MRLIDADALIDELGAEDEDIHFRWILEDCKTVAPTKHGYWRSVNEDSRGWANEFECSNCRRNVFLSCYVSGDDCGYEYCPHCGATMNNGV